MKPWLWIVIILVLLIIVIIIGLILLIPNLIRKFGFGRYDDDNTLHYFSHNDFEGMKQEEFTFKSNGLNLQGYLYQIENIKNKGIIVFAHGLGAGHIQYITEIHHFVKLGYLVYTFDAQGCLNSEGKGIEYISNYPKNLDDFLTYLEETKLNGGKYSLVGHSLGAYGVNLMPQFHNNIKRIVSLSGFDSTEKFMNDMLSSTKGLGNVITKLFCNQEKKRNKMYYLSSSEVLSKQKPNILLVSGTLDPLVKPESNFEHFKKVSKDNENAHFMLVEGRAHRPLLTLKASDYDTKMNIDLNNLKKKKVSKSELKQYYDSLDYNILVELDLKVMKVIDDFLDGKEIENNIVIKCE
ncbi:MAG: alpha/beta fold hydrolase [Erysipelotrichales bacterium]|nr:alpha/beta fold hydrolase [Erysipelotrichales bacterium]